MQQDDRNQPTLDVIRAAVREGRECQQTLRNYRKDGTLFWNDLTMSPVFDDQGTLTHFVGLQHDISDLVQASKGRWQRLATRIETLSTRQKAVLELLVAGKSTKAIAAELDISTKSVETHRARLLEKMEVDNVLELVRVVVTCTPDSP